MAGTILEDGVRMGGAIIEEVYQCLDGRLHAVCLCRGKCIEREEHSGVDSACVKEESANNLLEALCLGLI